MRKTFYILTLISLISCSTQDEKKIVKNETNQQPEIKTDINLIIDTAQISNYSAELNKWTAFYKSHSIKLTEFSFINEEELPDISAIVDSYNLSKDIYEPFYKFSPDSSIVLDLVSYNLPLELNKKNELISYGGDIDSEVSIKDLKNKIWKRILFVGSFYIIEDGFWINNDQLLITGQMFDTDQEKNKPIIWFVDIDKNIIQTFEYSHYIKNMNCDYLEKVRYKQIKMIK